MTQTTISIEGMHCASCVQNLERSLKKLHGVQSVSINLLLKKAFISSEHSLFDEEIRQAIEKVGDYRITNIESDQTSEKLHESHEHEHQKAPEDTEIQSWFKKLIGAWLFAIPMAILMLSDRLFGVQFFQERTMTIILLILGFPVIFFFGLNTIKSGAKGFTNLYFNMDSLIMLGVLVAYLTGILSLFVNIQDYSGVSAMIMAFFITGKYIEARARGYASQEIRKLIELGAKEATIIRGKQEIRVPISEIQIGDVMIIKPSEKIPTDGIIIDGQSFIDESMVTGEPMPVGKKKGNNVIGATINQDGILYVKATKVGKDTFLAHIIKLVEETQSQKIPIQELADKITSIFVPAVLLISVLTFFGWIFITSDLSRSISAAVSVLVIACPCALGLATPTAIMVGSGIGAKKGILIRKGEAIQTMKNIRTIVFDKTGTITQGKPTVQEVFSLVNQAYLFEIAASLEKLSEHPLSKSIVNYAKLKKYKDVKNFKVLRGLGIEGQIGKNKITIGNPNLMEKEKISIREIQDKIEEFQSKGYTTVVVSENKKPLGIIGISDSPKPESLEAIALLQSNGYRTIMLTGDNEKTASIIARQAGISEIIANVLPEDKSKKIQELQQKEMVAFVGDGINDAPALKQANVGIAIGTGTDIAIESGDIVLATGSLKGVVSAILLSKATFRKIKQNLFWAFAYNIVAVPVAIAGLLHPVIAEIAMALSSITVVTNANLLRYTKI